MPKHRNQARNLQKSDLLRVDQKLGYAYVNFLPIPLAYIIATAEAIRKIYFQARVRVTAETQGLDSGHDASEVKHQRFEH